MQRLTYEVTEIALDRPGVKLSLEINEISSYNRYNRKSDDIKAKENLFVLDIPIMIDGFLCRR